MRMMKKQLLILGFGALSFSGILSSCGRGPNDPGTEYMPDMYISRAYEPFSQPEDEPNRINLDGKNMREPAAGTIAQGQLAFYYPFPKNNDGYEAAKASWKMPDSIKNGGNEYLFTGKHYYDINCSPCHGEQGLGDGLVADKLPKGNVPSYASDRIQTLPEGGAYHSITYGINNMGSYASALTPFERWCVIKYMNYLKVKAKGTGSEPAPAAADSTKK